MGKVTMWEDGLMKPQESDINIKIRYSYFFAALFTGAALFLCSCERELETIKPFSETENLPIVEVVNIQTIFTDSGEVRYLLKAPKSLLFEKDGVQFYEFPEGVDVTTYDDNDQMISRITANYAKQFLREEKWEAKKNVVAINNKGDTLKTELLIWNRNEKKIHTQEKVTVIKPGKIIYGNGLEADESMKNWVILDISGWLDVMMGTGSPVDSLQTDPNGNKPLPANTGDKLIELKNS